MPTMAERLSLIPKLIISILNEIGPVKLELIIAMEGTSLPINVPRADPRIPPSNKKIKKKPNVPLSKRIIHSLERPYLKYYKLVKRFCLWTIFLQGTVSIVPCRIQRFLGNY